MSGLVGLQFTAVRERFSAQIGKARAFLWIVMSLARDFAVSAYSRPRWPFLAPFVKGRDVLSIQLRNFCGEKTQGGGVC